MNQEQAKSVARWLLTTFGSILISMGAKYGIDSGTIGALINSEMVVGLIAAAISLVWGLVSKTPIGLVLAAANALPVKEIVVSDPQLAVKAAGRTDQAVVSIRK